LVDYSIKDIYQGGYSSLNPNYGSVFTGYRINPGKIGMTTDPRTANVLKDASTKLNMGVKQIELAIVSPEIFDAIPKQQLQEINRLRKLTGADISVHGPVTEASGITQQGFDEMSRLGEERRFSEVLIRSHEVNPDGNVVVTTHSSAGLPGTEWKKIPEKGKGFAGESQKIIAVDRETGKMIPIEEDKKFIPGTELDISKPSRVYSPEQSLQIANESKWDQDISQLFFNKERADEILQQNSVQIQQLIPLLQEREKNGKDVLVGLTPTQQTVYLKMKDAENYLHEVNRSAISLFSKAYEYGTDNQREELKVISEKYGKEVEENKTDFLKQSQAMHKLLIDLQDPELAPRKFIPIEEFAIEKSSQTFGNAAFNAYKQLGKNAPILSIENPPAGGALSTGEELKDLIQASRKKFAERAVKEKGISESEANKLAEKFIGATWDVGHINMIRKFGFEDKDVVKESEKIAPFVKHVHLSDNFGFEHTELPMGMGNVPIKEIFEKLGQKGFDAKKIVEASSWWQHFQTPPFRETLEAFGSPIYGMQMAPYWNQSVGFQQDYSSGYGMMLPQMNYETFGAGFSRLPSELGGQRAGAEGSRMSGRGME
jgi:sugar phosphate isomerase/epimerase